MYSKTHSTAIFAAILISAIFSPPFSTNANAVDGEVRLNRVIELMEAGLPAFGIFSSNVSLRTGASVSGSRLDFVFIDLEHTPYDLDRLQSYLLGMINKRQIIEKGNLQPNVMPMVRIPAAGREQLLFVIKQVLDLGIYGLLVPHVETAEDARIAVQATRYPQLRDSPILEPEGLRGVGYSWPARYWGLTGAEYGRRADVWPLNPRGEIVLWLQIESMAAVENIDEILAVPGISGIFIGPSDLAFSMGVPLGDPEVEVEIQKVLRAAKAAGVPCGITAGPGNVEERLRQGFRFMTVGGDGGLSGGVNDALRTGEAFRRRQANP